MKKKVIKCVPVIPRSEIIAVPFLLSPRRCAKIQQMHINNCKTRPYFRFLCKIYTFKCKMCIDTGFFLYYTYEVIMY